MIYDGASAHANGESSEDRIIGKSAFNENADDNAYVGYMYGTPGSSTYEDTHANINDSTIKKYIDTWYEKNLKNTVHEHYLADNVFFNNRTIDKSGGNGFAKNTSFYFWHYLNIPFSLESNRKNDLFTKNNFNYGNGKLTYSIGLLTTEESLMCGGYDIDNTNYFLNISNAYWTFTPSDFNGASIKAAYRVINSAGLAYGAWGYVDSKFGVKPVINLKPNSLKSGDGTINNPYVVE